jgi:hypothetical protein
VKDWQFNVLFFVGVIGAVFLLIAPALGLEDYISKNPGNITGVGIILTYVLTQKLKPSHPPKKDSQDTTNGEKEKEEATNDAD